MSGRLDVLLNTTLSAWETEELPNHMMWSLNRFAAARDALISGRINLLNRSGNVRVHPSVKLSMSARLLSDMADGIVIGEHTLVAFKALLVTTDMLTGLDHAIHVGERCFIGGGAIIVGGVTIGDGAIVGAGAVVFEDVPAASIVGGNPARVLRHDISAGPYGRLAGADATNRRLLSAALGREV